jgi:uncharacterized lipoprotein YddW (UPF0748 family)
MARVRAQAVADPSAQEVRALWVTRTTLSSPESIARMIQAAQTGGFNTLLVQVRGRGDAYFSGTTEPRASDLTGRPGFDPLATILEQGHRSGLRVHAWIAVNLVSSAFELPASRQHVIYRQPDWLMVPREIAGEMLRVDPRSPEYLGRLARWTRANSSTVEGLYTSPLHAGVNEHVATVVKELVTKYAVDGVHLDYVRFPNDDFDFSRSALRQFKAAVQNDLTAADRRVVDAREALDPFAYMNMYPDRWSAFRRSRLTALVMRLRTVVKTARPSATVSAAVVPDVEQALSERHQDWRTWLDQGLIDVLCPMAYSADSQVFERQIATAQALAGDRPVWAGVGAYRLPPAQIIAHVAAARRLGAAGIAFFSYDALITPPNSAASLKDLGRAAFGLGSLY